MIFTLFRGIRQINGDRLLAAAFHIAMRAG
jgi:hypothetical protein